MSDLPLIYVDFETRSRADLDVLGGRRYAEHTSTEVLCAVLCCVWPDGAEYWYELGPDAGVPWDLSAGAFLAIAHNAINFDRHVWRRLGWPKPVKWIDTFELARVAGYPAASLEWLGANLCGVPKDLEGNKLTVSLSKPKLYYGAALDERVAAAKEEWRKSHPRGCGVRMPSDFERRIAEQLDAARHPAAPVDPATLARVVQYCRADVELMVRLHREFLQPWEDSDLPGLVEADRAINDRGILFDRELAELLLLADETIRDQAIEDAGVASATELSPQRLKAHLVKLGASVEDCTADTIQALLAECGPLLDDDSTRYGEAEREQAAAVAKLCRARQALSSIAAGKLRAGLARCGDDGRMRDNTQYLGAHTWRWSGSGMQLQNMAAGADLDVEASIEALNSGRLDAVYWEEIKS